MKVFDPFTICYGVFVGLTILWKQDLALECVVGVVLYFVTCIGVDETQHN